MSFEPDNVTFEIQVLALLTEILRQMKITNTILKEVSGMEIDEHE